MTAMIDTIRVADRYRNAIVRRDSREVLISRLSDSDQENDLTLPPNCSGLGRVRHFRRDTPAGWPANPLPIDPARKALGLAATDLLTAQVFQNAACAWRCWYCYVPYNMLGADERRSRWMTADDLVAAYLAEETRPLVIDLSGGSPDLTPEWVVWMMEALEKAGLEKTVYLWSDDNLSTDYVFSKLDSDQRRRLVEYRNYGRVCCFKGFDEASFTFNTGARSDGFERQFQCFSRYLELGLDLYAYATFTAESPSTAEQGIKDFLDRLQQLSPKLPLRLVPLQVAPFGPMLSRLQRRDTGVALGAQEVAIAVWNTEIAKRFSDADRAMPIADISLYA